MLCVVTKRPNRADLKGLHTPPIPGKSLGLIGKLVDNMSDVVRIVRPKKARTGSKRPIEDKQRGVWPGRRLKRHGTVEEIERE